VIWVRHVACLGETRNAYKILVRKPEGKRPIGRLRHKLGSNIRVDLREIGWEGVDWFCEHNNEPLCSIKGREFLD
jgi:hypothetical protein